ncbi:hypothetical protein DPEC_G00238660 [Dallia pectoralis]|uniref:Uncharacterized protein n=1 Tax=Dallia pectoralis TaxID=75939 RepID=A0ACC2FZ14_DALPE|nr:hypothetical protein DPEC_G00238660 [Dallia pectoralis]
MGRVLGTQGSYMLEDWVLMAQLKDSSDDLMLTDLGLHAGTDLSHYLYLTTVNNAHWKILNGDISQSSPISYMPVPGYGLSENKEPCALHHQPPACWSCRFTVKH